MKFLVFVTFYLYVWYLSHFTYTSLLTEGERCNTSSEAGAYIGVGLAIAESFESYRLRKSRFVFV